MASDKKINIDLLINDAQAAKTWGQNKKAIKDLKSAMLELGDEGSKDFLKVAAAAGQMQKKMKETQAVMEALGSTGAKIGALAGVGKKVAAGFEGAAAASALFGEKNEAVEKTLLKVQAAASMTRAIGEFAELGEAGEQASAVIKDAFSANPLAVILIALTAIAAIGGAIYENYFSTVAVSKELEKQDQKRVDAAQSELDLVEGSSEQYKLQGKSQTEILKLKDAAVKTVIKESEVLIQQQKTTLKAQIDASKRNKAILKGILDFVSIPIRLLLKTVDTVGTVLGQNFGLLEGYEKGVNSVAELLFDPKKTEEEGEKTIKESELALNKLKDKEAGFQNEINDIRKKAAEDAANKREEETKKFSEALKKQVADELTQLTADEQAKVDTTKEGTKERLAAVEAMNAATEQFSTDNAIFLGKTDADLNKEQVKNAEATAKIKQQIADEEAKFIKDAADEEVKGLKNTAEEAKKIFEADRDNFKKSIYEKQQSLNDWYLAQIDLADATGQDTTAIDAKYDEEQNKLKKDSFKKNLDMAKSYASSVESTLKDIGSLANDIDQQKINADKEASDAAISNIKNEANTELSQANLTADQKTAIKNKEAQDEYAIKLKAYDTEVALKKKQFDTNKKLQYSQAVISAALGVANAFTIEPAELIPVAVTTQAIAAAAALAKIKTTSFDAGSPPAAPNLNAGSSASFGGSSASFGGSSPLTQQNLQQIGSGQPMMNNPNSPQAGLSNGQRTGAQKVYVVSTDLTKAQNADAVLTRRASFGPK